MRDLYRQSATAQFYMPYEALLTFRVKKILMICSNYDAFTLEEDGQIESELFKEYTDLHLTEPPRFVWAKSADAAREILSKRKDIDMIICMYNEHDKNIFPLAGELKASGSKIPFVLLIYYSKEVRRQLSLQDNSVIDYFFSWHGNADLILAIVKLYEDMHNAENDILKVGVQAILLVEDSIRYYSTYLPELYKLVLMQSNEFLKETLNAEQRKNRKRSRPKILLATCYEDALELFDKYKSNILGVISDVGMIVHKGDLPKDEKLDAGIDFAHKIKAYNSLMPILLQSSQEEFMPIAKSMGIGFLKKYSRTLFLQLTQFVKEEFGFGDFVFKDRKGQEIGRAANLNELEKVIQTVPDEILESNTSRNMFSKWFYARGLFTLASRFRSEHHTVASDARAFIKDQITLYHDLTGRGIIAQFDRNSYKDYIWFSRIGQSSLGGKARGLAFLNSLVQKYGLSDKYGKMKVSTPRTIVITTEFFEQFILDNGLQYVIDAELSDDEILSEFVASRLPEELIEDLKVFIGTVNVPLAVRSSSKLEDSNDQPFAGVYSTYMVPSTENKDQLLRMLDKAIKSVYASEFFNGSRSYIQSTENLLSEEKMGVIIQTICGTEHDGLYYPMLSGVARSVNYYPIGSEKDDEGIVNLAFGLGKTVVEGGCTLRFSPSYPKKILQLSNPKSAMKDTQKNMYALSMRPADFKISRNESMNFAHISVNDALKSFDYPNMVTSYYDFQNDVIRTGYEANACDVVTFDAILKYDKFPLAEALREILSICRQELTSEIEIEFAADVIPGTDGDEMVLKLLQVRPIREYMDVFTKSMEEVESELSNVFVKSDKALGIGYIGDIDYIVLVPPESFDNTQTKEIAKEVSSINNTLKASGKSFILIGPGRWGSSDPFLGIPVIWSDISEAKTIVEYGLIGYEIEPSQGTHFFQNITSQGVGYLSVDDLVGNGSIDFAKLNGLSIVDKTSHATVLKGDKPFVTFIDRNHNKAVIGY